MAPAAAALFAVLAQSIRHVRTIRIFGRPVGAALSRALLLALVVDVSLLVAQRFGDSQGWGGWGLSDRADLLHDLESKPGKHVVLVRYGPEHSVHEELVFNATDIDASQEIWARDLPSLRGPPSNNWCGGENPPSAAPAHAWFPTPRPFSPPSCPRSCPPAPCAESITGCFAATGIGRGPPASFTPKPPLLWARTR